MNIAIVKEIAKLRGVNCDSDSQLELIRRMQIKEGNQPCYGTKKYSCYEQHCMWRSECQGKVRKLEIV